jgi:hypothetical protein
LRSTEEPKSSSDGGGGGAGSSRCSTLKMSRNDGAPGTMSGRSTMPSSEVSGAIWALTWSRTFVAARRATWVIVCASCSGVTRSSARGPSSSLSSTPVESTVTTTLPSGEDATPDIAAIAAWASRNPSVRCFRSRIRLSRVPRNSALRAAS